MKLKKIILLSGFILFMIPSLYAQLEITSNVDPNVGYQVGQSYTFTAVGCNNNLIIWSGTGISPEFPASNGTRTFTTTITGNNFSINADTGGPINSNQTFCPQSLVSLDGTATGGQQPTRVPCTSDCNSLGLKSGDFEESNERILWTNWTRKIRNIDGSERVYGFYDYLGDENGRGGFTDCAVSAGNDQGACMQDAGLNNAAQEACEAEYDQAIANCEEDFLNLPEISNEHAITSNSTSLTPSAIPVYPTSDNEYAEGATNEHSLALGFGNGALSGFGGSSSNGGELSYQAIEATIEQTFFLGKGVAPRLDFWYVWGSVYYESQEEEPTEEELERFINAPIFSIKVFEVDQDGNKVESIYQKVDTQEDYTIEDVFGNVIYKDWNYEPIYIDLSAYKYKMIKVEITSYDRFSVDDGGVITDRFNSSAFVDFICSQCCVPAPNITADVTNSNGVFTITRPPLPCEDVSIPEEERCTPNFLYQITSPQGEPYVVEGTGVEVSFVPRSAGQYTVLYKHSKSCCWSEEPLTFEVQQGELNLNLIPTFENELKSAGIHCVPSFYLDSVLAVGATTFLDRQFVNTQEIAQTENKEEIENYLLETNPYLSGERGVWRTEGSYAYVTERRGTKTLFDADNITEEEAEKGTLARTGGIFELNMFNWQNRGVLPKNWRKVSETSRYNPYTYGIESRDVLGRYSAALYGYKGQLSTAVCANAEYVEIACEGFEEESATSNFRIENPDAGTVDRSLVFHVLWAKGDKGVLEGYVPEGNTPITLDASLIAYMIGKQDIIEIKPQLINGELEEQLQVTLTRRDDKTSFFTITGSNLPTSLFLNQWYGTMAIARQLPSLPSSVLEMDNINEGHTGKKSLPITQETTLLQSDLLLKSNEKYVISAWVKVNTEEKQLYTYEGVGLSLVFYKQNGSELSVSQEIKPLGNIIEGWQRIEGTIIVPENAFFVAVRFKNTNTFLTLYDDIRIFPADGSMKTFVYDPSNYLLRAVLDENNYASLYFYDDAQRLYLLQKETREGIYTIQETHNHVKHRIDD